MSDQDVWTVVGRAVTDVEFATRLRSDFEAALADAGYRLEPEDLEKLRRAVFGNGAGAAPQAQLAQMNLEQMEFLAKRARDLQSYTLDLFKNTLGSAHRTYQRVTWMNTTMFVVGIGLFLGAAVYGVFAEQKVYSLVFGGLGAATFIALFLLGPIEKTQTALSNLVQAEIAFMDYYEQITILEAYALGGASPPTFDPARIEKASDMLQIRTRETVELLQKYLEPAVVPDESGAPS